jgi:diguanylate cyclase (GGDEF)-like protein/PAS domain S-box-containing protein
MRTITGGLDGNSMLSRTPPLSRLVKVALLLGFLSFATRQLNVGSWNSGGVTILWPSNGFLLGVLLCNPKRQWPAYVSIGWLIDFSINLSLDTPFVNSVYLSGCNMLEVLLAAFLLYPIVAPKPELTERKQLVAFLSYGVVLAPAVASFLASFLQTAHLRVPTFHDFHRWFTADALGIATITPLYLAFQQREGFSGRSQGEIVGLFLLLFAVTLAVFSQTLFPVLFLVMLVLLVLGARLGLAASALGLLVVSILGGFLTTAGRGPVALMRSNSISERDLLFQLFIITSMLLLYIVEVLIQESRHLQADVQSSERRFRLLAEASSDIIVLTDLDGMRHYVSPSVFEVLGWRPEDLLGASYTDLVHPDDVEPLRRLFEDCLAGGAHRALEYRCRKHDGGYAWLEINPRLYHAADSDAPAGFVKVARDVSWRKAREEELQRAFEDAKRLASTDPLTGVANRRHFDLVMEREWLRAAREQTRLSLLLMDVDLFKSYNDIYGHVTGDECLRSIVKAAQGVLKRPADLLARYGGEELVVVLPNTEAEGALQIAEQIRCAVEDREIPHVGNAGGRVTISIGCATLAPMPGFPPAALVLAADSALYQAKGFGRNNVQLAGRFPAWEPALVSGLDLKPS